MYYTHNGIFNNVYEKYILLKGLITASWSVYQTNACIFLKKEAALSLNFQSSKTWKMVAIGSNDSGAWETYLGHWRIISTPGLHLLTATSTLSPQLQQSQSRHVLPRGLLLDPSPNQKNHFAWESLDWIM